MSASFTPADAMVALEKAGGAFITLFRQGTLEIEIYRPVGTDPQKPHAKDEIYVVISGRGSFLMGAERVAFAPGDVLFVEAGVEHRFVDFTADFATWVFFYGPRAASAPETSPIGDGTARRASRRAILDAGSTRPEVL
ncbi:MAG: cupin domain-containing protein [Gammaproteobacteria bacterium]